MIQKRRFTGRAILGLIVVYQLVGAFVVATQPMPGVALWYPPVGIGMAATAFFGYKAAAIVLLCDFVVTELQYKLGLEVSIIVALATTCECLIFYACHKRLNRDVEYFSFRVFFLYFLSIVFAALAGAILGTGLLFYVGGQVGKTFLDQLTFWWVGDVTGALTVVTAPLLIFNRNSVDELHIYKGYQTLLKLCATLFSISAILVASFLILQIPSDTPDNKLADLSFGIKFLIIVPVAYAAINFNPKVVSLFVVYLNTLASILLFFDQGFHRTQPGSVAPDLIRMQLTLISLNLVAVGIAMAVYNERRALSLARQFYYDLLNVSRRNMAGEVAAALAHEINQPISAIGGYAAGCIERLKRRQSADSDLHEALQKIDTYAQQAGNIVDRLRRFLRREEPAKTLTGINDCLREAAALLAEKARQNNVAIELALHNPSPDALVERVAIQQVVANLILNAIEAVIKRNPKLRQVTLSSTLTPDNLVEIAVEDTGTGLPAGMEDKVFEPYYTTKADGLGFGLAISRSIVLNHGGRLWAETRADRGAVFRFTLPAVGSNSDG